MRTIYLRALCVAAALTCLFCRAASADVVTYGMCFEFSGGTPPAGVSPWMTATIDDGGGSGSVTLTLDNLNLVGGEFVSGWYFNLDPILDPDSLIFSAASTFGGNGFDLPTIETETNDFKADGDGLYDILFDFSTSGQGGGIHRFGAGETFTVTISGIPGLNAHSFQFLSMPAGGHGPFFTAAHVQGINGSDSGWVTIPEPSSMLIGLGASIGAIGLVLRRRARLQPKASHHADSV